MLETPNEILIIQEFVEGITLDKYLENNDGFLKNEEVKSITSKLLEALQYLHSLGIMHRDI